MKKILLFVSVLLAIAGCQKNNNIEVIPSYDSIYLTSDNVDTSPKLIQGDEKKLFEAITKDLGNTSEGKINLDYRLLLNEKGNVEKMLVVKSPDKKITDLVASTVVDWKFEPAMKNNKAVNSQYRLEMNQPEEMNINESGYLPTTDVMPEIIGGMKELQKNIIYPEKAKQNGVEGKVFVKVFIDENGVVTMTKILKSAGPDLDKAAINAIKKLNFVPGKKDGKPVKVAIVIPIVFKLS